MNAKHHVSKLILFLQLFLVLIKGCIWIPSKPKPTPPSTVIGNCQCGVSSQTKDFEPKPTTRNTVPTTNSSDAVPGEFPWQVLISRPVNGGTYDNCGGVLLSSDTVLTGAHCTLDGSEVVVGEYDRSKPDGEQRISIKEIIRHPIWIENSAYFNSQCGFCECCLFSYDFAIVKLATHVSFSSTVNPICLPSDSANYDSVAATLTGWGTYILAYWPKKNILQKTKLKTMSNSECTERHEDSYLGGQLIRSSQICAVAEKPCYQYESGGPLVTDEGHEGGYLAVIGIGSWSINCRSSDNGIPGVYARVTDQLSWINEHITGTICPKP